jgi:hypothetical protein
MAFPDIFNNLKFSMTSLTAAVNEIAYVPGQVSSLGLFEEEGVPTVTVAIERQGDSVAMVPTTPRGAPAPKNVDVARSILDLRIPHLQLEDEIYADEVQGVREFGSESSLRTVERLIASKQRRMTRNLDLTMEFHALGALRGKLYDSNGSSLIYNYYTEMNEAEPSAVDFDLDNATPASGALRQKCSDVIRAISVTLGGLPFSRIHALCGSTFFDQFQAHKEYREVHLNFPAATVLRAEVPYTQFGFGGITFEEYRGPSSGPTFIAAGDAWFFPVGVPGMYLRRFAPADTFEAVNTIGLPRYSMARPDANAPNRRAIVEVQSNVLHICTRPRAIRRGTNT